MRKNKSNNVPSVVIAYPIADVQKSVDVTIPDASVVASVVIPSVKQKSPQVTDGCMIGRMSLFRQCVVDKKTLEETLTIIRAKYPFGLTGTNAHKWIAKHYARIEKKLVPAVPVQVPVQVPEINPIASASALIDASAIVANASVPTITSVNSLDMERIDKTIASETSAKTSVKKTSVRKTSAKK